MVCVLHNLIRSQWMTCSDPLRPQLTLWSIPESFSVILYGPLQKEVNLADVFDGKIHKHLISYIEYFIRYAQITNAFLSVHRFCVFRHTKLWEFSILSRDSHTY